MSAPECVRADCRMVGSVVENLSNGKLWGLLGLLAVAQTGFFLLGGLVSPAPSSHMTFLMTKCIDINYSPLGRDEWFYLRPGGHCRVLDSTYEYKVRRDPREIVYVAQMPHVRDGVQLQYSPWFQSLLGLLTVETEYGHDGLVWPMAKAPTLTLEVRLGYKGRDDASTTWHELAASSLTRSLECHLDPEEAADGGLYQCEPLDLFELGSTSEPFYLLNVRLPACNESLATRPNCDVGRIEDLSLVAIHQNGGFTQVWLALKTLLFPCVALALRWYWRRLGQLPRPPVLLERAILGLGLCTAALDVPVEWISVVASTPWLLLLSDLRQGLFYLALGAFWMVYAGEHLTGDVAKHRLSFYRGRLGVLGLAWGALLIYDLCERGRRLGDPFYSLWGSEAGTRVAYALVVLAALAGSAYFVWMAVAVVRVWRGLARKRSGLRSASEGRQIRFQGLLFRLKFLMGLTLLCVGLTVGAGLAERVGEGQLHWGDWEAAPAMNYSAAFLTGVYGMWNLYVLLLLAMYAPSHKRYHAPLHEDEDADQDPLCPKDEGLALTAQGPAMTQESPLTTFLKPGSD